MKISKPVNQVQVEFNELCDKGGGRSGGPARTKVQELLHNGSKKLNHLGYEEITHHLAEFPEANPWHVCFAIGLGWGHLAKIELTFTEAAIRVLESNDVDALKVARTFHLERGPLPIEQSLRGGYLMFQKVRLPKQLPDTLAGFGRAQQRWYVPLVSPSEERPKYIGAWNATAMFMVGLFSKPSLAAQLVTVEHVALPPNGPIYAALKILHQAHILPHSPAGTELDDESAELGLIVENNGLMADLLKGHSGWSLVDVHSGLYMLGTRYPLSNQWA